MIDFTRTCRMRPFYHAIASGLIALALAKLCAYPKPKQPQRKFRHTGVNPKLQLPKEAIRPYLLVPDSYSRSMGSRLFAMVSSPLCRPMVGTASPSMLGTTLQERVPE